MKQFLYCMFIATLITGPGNRLFAQTIQAIDTTCIVDSVQKDTLIVLPPLFDVIDSAIKHNSVVKFRNLEIEAKKSNLKSQQNNWTRNMGVQADTRYGTFDSYSANANGQSSSFISTTSKQFNYGAGLYLKFPILDLLDRKNLVKKAKTEIEQAKNMAEAQQDEVRLLVIKLYQDLLLKHRLLHIRSQSLGNARVNMEMVEKQFRNGTIPLAEYVRISDNASGVESDYEIAKTDFITAKQILEEIAGFSFIMPPQAKDENN
jgi:outer membrane protein TolC